MRYSLHIHRWGPWTACSLITTVKRTCDRCPGVQFRGLWTMTERQWAKVVPREERP